MALTEDQKRQKAERLIEIVRKGNVAIFKYLSDLEDKVDELLPSMKELIVRMRGDKGEKGDRGERGSEGKPGKDGRDGIDGRDGKDGKDGKNGKDGITPDTETVAFQAAKIAEARLSPFIPKVEDIAKDLPKLGERIRDGLEILQGNDRLDKSAIRGLDEALDTLDKKTSALPQAIGRRALSGSSFSFAGDGSTTTFYLPQEPAGKGMFIFAHYQGQWLQQGVHYTLAGKQFNTLGGTSTFTPEDGTVIEGFLINF